MAVACKIGAAEALSMIPEEQRKKLAELYATSFSLYQASEGEQGELFSMLADRADGDDDPLGQMEFLATDIGGYVSTLIDFGELRGRSHVAAIEHLRRLVVLDDPEIKPFLREHAHEYPDLVRYMQMLETVRCEAIAMLEASLKAP